jgi:hypothetical protein
VVSVERIKTPTVVEVVEPQKPKPIAVTVEEPLKLEDESEEFEEVGAVEATAPATETPKHNETPPKPTEDEETEESLKLEEEELEEEEPIVVEEQAQEEPKGRAGSRLQEPPNPRALPGPANQRQSQRSQ